MDLSDLPAPVSYSKHRRIFRRNAPVTTHRTIDVLLARARVTNLGFIILSSFAVLSFLYNLHLHFSYYPPESWRAPPLSITSTLSRPKSFRELNHLIIVPGHSIWKGSDPDLRLDEEEWLLEPYQKGGGRVSAFVSHIARGAQLARDDEHSLLVFSGGQTRSRSITTEAESYLRLALSSNLFQQQQPRSHPFPRATTENFALDSFQNLLFSIARFHEYTGRWPEFITVVGYEMKRRRFTELHRAAVRWPLVKFGYVGVDAQGENAAAKDGELQNGYTPYTADAYGCHSTLQFKRQNRNPFSRFHSYYTSSPELGPLFDWCPDVRTRLFDGSLPWDTS